MDVSVLVVVTYPVQLLVKSLIQHCQHHWSMVLKRRRETMNHTKNLKKILMQRCSKFSVTMTFSVSEISDNDSLSSVDMDDDVYRYKSRVCCICK